MSIRDNSMMLEVNLSSKFYEDIDKLYKILVGQE